MSHYFFCNLNNLIKDHKALGSRKDLRQPSFHLMSLIFYLGSKGNGASFNISCNIFRNSLGSNHDYCKQTQKVFIKRFYNCCVVWPDQEERGKISNRIFHKYGIPNYVGLVDKALLPLNFFPERHNWFDFQGGKGGFSLFVLFDNNEKSSYTTIYNLLVGFG